MSVRPIRTFLLILAASVLSGCQRAPGPLPEAEVQALRRLTDQWVQDLLAKDWDALSMVYTEDAVLMPPGQEAIRGRSAIREFNASFPALAAFTAITDTIDGVGDLAYVRGRYRMTLAVDGATDSGKYLEIRRRQSDGSWKIAVDIFNSSSVPPSPAP